MGQHEGNRRVIEVRVLGQVSAWVRGTSLDIGGPRQQVLLAMLAQQVGRVASTDALIDAVWDGDPPNAAERTFRTYVARLRKALTAPASVDVDGTELVAIEQAGYRLAAGHVVTDADRFEELVGEARSRVAAGEPAVAASMLDEALGLWQGAAYAAFADRPWVRTEALRLEELRLVARELRLQALLDAGRVDEIGADLDALARDHPYRESLVRLQVLARYRVGRHADALGVLRAFRERLVEEAGLDTSAQLDELERMVLDQDPRLDRPVGGRRLRGYVLHEVVAESSVGAVHRAEQPSIGREVAITVLPPDRADDPDVVRAFEARAQQVAAIEHPHVVPLYDFWREPGGAYLVTRFPAGGTLAQRLARGPLDDQEVARLVGQIGGALAAAHAQGVAHGAVDARAVVLDGRGDAFLAAFPPVATALATSADLGGMADLIDTLVAGSHGDGSTKVATRVERLTTVARDDADDAIVTVGALVEAVLGVLVEDEGGIVLADVVGGNPYRGLAAFGETDADVFFGREQLVIEVLGRLARQPFVAVSGPSGAGKSSVVRAGVLPRLRSDGGYVTTMVPGRAPMAELVVALSRIAASPLPEDTVDRIVSSRGGLNDLLSDVLPEPEGDAVLVVDQFEELFTLAPESEREAFLTTLSSALDHPLRRLQVIVTVRADFLGQVLDDRLAGPLVHDRTVLARPMTADELHEVVVGPAEVAGVAVEPELATAIVADAVRSVGSLPMVQFALTEVFEAAEDGTMTLAAYRRLGGIEGVLGQRAEEVYAGLNQVHAGEAQTMFRRLVVPRDDGPPARRRARRSELAAVSTEVVDAFGAARLVRFDHDEETREPTVEVTHEALFKEWPRLVAWIEAGVDDLRLLGHLTVSAEDWDAGGREDADLYRGARLDAALAFSADHDGELTQVEHDFVDAGRQRREQQQERERRGQRRLRQLTSGLAVGLVVALVAGGLAWSSRQEEAAVRAEAQADALAFAAIAALEQDDLERGALLAAEAYAAAPDLESQGALLGVLGVDPRSVPGFATPGAYCSDASGDASRIAFPTLTAGGADIEVRTLDGEVVETLPWRSATATCVTLSPTTDHLVQILFGGLEVEDPVTGTVLAARDDLHFQDSPQFFALHPSAPEAVLLRADGTVEFVSVPELDLIATGEVGLELGARDTDDAPVVQAAVGYSEDGSLAFAAEAGTLHVLDAADGQLIGTYDAQPLEEAVSGYVFPFVSAGAGVSGYVIGRELVVTSLRGDRATRRIDLGSSASPLGVMSGAPVGRGVAVEPGGRHVAVVTEAGVVVVDLERGAPVGAPLPSDTTSLEVRWADAGDLVGVGSTGVVRFDVDQQLTYGSLERDELWPQGILFPASDGSGTIVDGPELLFVETRGGDTLTLEDLTVPAAARALTGGRWISARRDTGVVRIGDVDGVRFEQQLPVAYDVPSLVAIEPAGDRVGLVIANIEGDAGGWILDGRTGAILTSLESDENDPLEGVAPLGDDLALVRTVSGTVTVHDGDGQVVDEARVFGISNGVMAGSPSGRSYVVGDFAGTLHVVNRVTGELTELVGAFASPAAVAFVDDDLLVSHHGDGSTWLWDVREGRRVGKLWSVPASFPATTAVDRSTRELIQPVEGGLARFPLDPDAWLDAVCSRVSRGLTATELDAVAGGVEAIDPCDGGRAT